MAATRKQTPPAANIFKDLNRQNQLQAIKKALRKKAKTQQRNQQLRDTKESILREEDKNGE